MSENETLIRDLFDAGCTMETAERIEKLCKAGSCCEALQEMKMQRCALVEQMHESQRKVDRMDFLIRNQEKHINK